MGESPRRKPTRLAGYDYRAPGVYFVTVVTRGRACLFGEVDEGGMYVKAAGRMVERWWLALPGKFACVSLDAFVVMPNHFHGLLELNAGIPVVGADPRVGPHPRVGSGAYVGPEETGAHTGATYKEDMRLSHEKGVLQDLWDIISTNSKAWIVFMTPLGPVLRSKLWF